MITWECTIQQRVDLRQETLSVPALLAALRPPPRPLLALGQAADAN